jgi:hypothetical protein
MRTFHLILYIVAAVCFLIAFISPGITARGPESGLTVSRWNLMAAGLLAWVIVPLSVVIDDIAD